MPRLPPDSQWVASSAFLALCLLPVQGHSRLGSHVLKRFGVRGEPTLLPRGSRPVFRVDGLVLKHLRPGSLEHDRSLDLAPWLAEGVATLPQARFRMPRPVRTRDGLWLTEDGWTAWTYLEGHHATAQDLPTCIDSIVALHRALRAVPKHPLLDRNQSPFGRADTACWSDKPDEVHPAIEPLVDALYALRWPLDGLEELWGGKTAVMPVSCSTPTSASTVRTSEPDAGGRCGPKRGKSRNERQ